MPFGLAAVRKTNGLRLLKISAIGQLRFIFLIAGRPIGTESYRNRRGKLLKNIIALKKILKGYDVHVVLLIEKHDVS